MLEIRDGYIGDQGIEGGMHNGNKWYDKSFIVVPVEHAYCSPPEQAPNSVFRANTPQSVRNPFGLAGYIYFSEFHPADINPDQTDEWFKEDPSGYPGMGCVDHIVVATETDRAIADGTIITTGLSPAHSWTGKRYLYDKLKQNPSLQDEYSEFSTFLNNESQTAVGQLYAVEQKITEALKIPVEMEIQLGQLKTQENAVLTDILLADSLLNTSSILEEMTTVTHDKEEALKALQNIDSLYNELNIGYQANLTTKFQEALALNELVTSAAPYEKYEKIVNDIVLRQLLFQSGELTDEQVTILNTIASECPKYNGHGVYRARGLLTGCNERNWDDSNNECSPLENLVQEQVIGNGIGERTTAKLAGTENIFIYPNPATDGVYIQTKPDYSGQLLIQDMTGKKWKEVLFKSKEITQYIDLANVPNGVYFCTVSYSNGERQVFKFFVVKP